MTDRLPDFEAWLRKGGVKGRPLGDDTIATYLKVASLISRSRSPVAILKPGLAVNTKNKYVAVLRQWAAFTEDIELEAKVKPGPELHDLLQIRKSKLPSKTEIFTEEELRRFLFVLDQCKGFHPRWAWPCISLQLALGLRAGADLAGIRRDAVEEAVETGSLVIMGKRDTVNQMPAGFIESELRELLDLGKWKVVADLISPQTISKPWLKHRENAYQGYRKMLAEIGRIAGLNTSKTHRLRHQGISDFHNNVSDGDPLRTQRFARHLRLDTTIRYIHQSDMSEDDARLGELRERMRGKK